MNSLTDEAARESILLRLSRLRPDSQSLWGQMSANGMLCHLNDSFLTCFGEKEVSSASGLLQRTVMKFVALQTPLTWPKNVATRPEVAQGIGGTNPIAFERDREQLIATIQRFVTPDENLGQHPHPFFGHMSHREWMRWGYLHLDHHLRQFGV